MRHVNVSRIWGLHENHSAILTGESNGGGDQTAVFFFLLRIDVVLGRHRYEALAIQCPCISHLTFRGGKDKGEEGCVR